MQDLMNDMFDSKQLENVQKILFYCLQLCVLKVEISVL
jgi:hypothetical protein